MNDEKFEQLYNEIIAKSKNELEGYRKSTKKAIISRIILLIITFFAVLTLMYILFEYVFDNFGTLEVIFMFLFIIGYAFLIKHITKKIKLKAQNYNKVYKENVIYPIIKSYGKDFKYNPDYGISSNIYSKANFEKYDIYNSHDLIRGKLESNNIFSLAEVLTQDIIQDRKGHTYFQDVFSGLFMDTKLSKNINSCIYFRKDKGPKNFLSKIPLFKSSMEKMKLELDSSEFEKFFDVFSDNRMLTMQILSVDIMQAIIDFKRETNLEFEITIKNDDVFIRFICGKTFEKGNAWKKQLKKELLYRYYKILGFSLNLSNMLIKSINDVIL